MNLIWLWKTVLTHLMIFRFSVSSEGNKISITLIQLVLNLREMETEVQAECLLFVATLVHTYIHI